MKSFIMLIISLILSGCVQTQKLDRNSPSVIQSGAKQRNSILMPKNAQMYYCPDAPAEIATEYTVKPKVTGTDAAGNTGEVSGEYETAIINLANRNAPTNVLIYSVNYLCFFSMNGTLNSAQVDKRFEQILNLVEQMSENDKKVATAVQNESETRKKNAETRENESATARANAETQRLKTQMQVNQQTLQK